MTPAPRPLLLWLALLLCWCVGILGRGYWTPDEPREADIAWRMSWQADKAVPLLAGEPFCEKPPLTYWIAAAAMHVFGDAAWAARLPNLLYAWVTALALGWLGRRSAGPIAGVAAAAAVSTFLLSYQVAIWLATDAPLVAAVAVALLGLHMGFYALTPRERLWGYTCMHTALGLGFLAKSAAAWMVPGLTLAALVVWERRWRELLRWELYAGLAIQAALILGWVWAVTQGTDGPAHLKVFFWNNLVGRFAPIDAPVELQYATAHRNSTGKYLVELPAYLWPWSLLVLAAGRRAWRQRHGTGRVSRLVRFAVATFVPTLAVLSVAATARNIYLAPALPGVALLLGGWAAGLRTERDLWDERAVRATAVLLLLATAVVMLAVGLITADSWVASGIRPGLLVWSVLGLGCAGAGALHAWRAAGRVPHEALAALLLAYTSLLAGPAVQIYRGADAWQDLPSIGRAMALDAAGKPLILFAPDETTRAFIDMYARPTVLVVPGPDAGPAALRLQAALGARPESLVVIQLPGRAASPTLAALEGRFSRGQHGSSDPAGAGRLPGWIGAAGLHIAHVYTLPNGRRYALLERGSATASR